MPLPSVIALTLLLTCGLALAGPTTAPTVRRDVVYGRAGGVDLKLDAVVPAGSGPHPAVILVHGGAWQAGDKTHFHALFAPLMNGGLATFSINYRLAPRYPFPACIDDVETAIKWVKEHATEYDVDPARVALLGESAGGHLVELVAGRATKDSNTQTAAVVAMYAPSDLKALADFLQSHGAAIGPSLNALFGRTTLDATTLALIRDASPVTHVHAGMPPFLLVHGTADRLVPFSQSVSFAAALKAVGVPVELVPVAGGAHGMIFWGSDTSYKDKIVAFLTKTLATATH